MHTDVLAPTPERKRRREVERMTTTIADDKGNIGRPFRVIDTLMLMERSGAIRSHMKRAGEQFRDDFAVAMLDPLWSGDLARIPGTGKPGDAAAAQYDARDRVWKAVCMLGGMASPAGCCAWHVLGCGRSVRDWALREGWVGRPLRHEVATGILVATLGLLANHYDIPDPAERKSA